MYSQKVEQLIQEQRKAHAAKTTIAGKGSTVPGGKVVKIIYPGVAYKSKLDTNNTISTVAATSVVQPTATNVNAAQTNIQGHVEAEQPGPSAKTETTAPQTIQEQPISQLPRSSDDALKQARPLLFRILSSPPEANYARNVMVKSSSESRVAQNKDSSISQSAVASVANPVQELEASLNEGADVKVRSIFFKFFFFLTFW